MTIQSNRPTRLVLAALLGASLGGTAAVAQEASDTDLTAQVQEMQPEIEPAPENISDLVSDLSGPGVAIPIEGLPEDASFETRTVSELAESGDGSDNTLALDSALARSQTRLDMLQTQISGVDAINKVLSDAGYSADEVIGVYQTDKGSFTVLIDDRA